MVTARRFPARLEVLDEVHAFIKGEVGQDQLADRSIDLVMAVEEAFTNVAKHAYEEGGDVEVTVDRSPAEVAVILRDTGRPFDPSTVPSPDLTAAPEDRPVGSLGVHLIYRLTDEVRYRRDGDQNVLTLIVRKAGGLGHEAQEE